MALIPYIVAYLAIGVFVIACIARFMMWSRMPMSVRWELYPVAHEASRAHYGGSYLEETDWWKKPREKSMVGELKVMIPEILFLVALKEHNPKLWLRSFPFHFGLYLVIGATALMFGAALLMLVAPTALSGTFGEVWRAVVLVCGVGGLGLSLLGAIGLLQRRLTDPELKDFTTPADIFNLVFFIVAFGVALIHVVAVDHKLALSMGFVHNMVSFKMAALPAGSSLTVASVLLMGLLVAYIPLTHMSHFIGKYFAYHAIRWDDKPNTPGSEMEAPIKEVLSYPVSWAAPYIKGDGKKTWADVATEEQKQ